MTGPYSVECFTCGQEVEAGDLEYALKIIRRHYENRGCTFPDEQVIKKKTFS